MTVPTGVSVNVRSCCVQCSEPGATPGQIFTVVCARADTAAITLAAATSRSRRHVLVEPRMLPLDRSALRRRAMAPSPCRGRLAGLTLERAAERRLRIVADL